MNNRLEHFARWLDACSQAGRVLCVKRLSGNDTLANRAHQAGPYIPKDLLFEALPALNRPKAENPRVKFALSVASHEDQRTATAIWYNNRKRGGTRNEARITGLGGAGSALLDPESTGAIAIFDFSASVDNPECRVWICASLDEEDFFQSRYQTVIPGEIISWTTTQSTRLITQNRQRAQAQHFVVRGVNLPFEWLSEFPSPMEIANKAQAMCPAEALPNPDDRLIERRQVEFELFLGVEEITEMPRIKEGFDSIEDFVNVAQSVMQRRKARSGRSLELHVRSILMEEGLIENVDFSYQPKSEGEKRPDFLFPSASHYRDSGFPDESLRMLAVKTTCRDRWRQMLREADRVKTKHLLTLQEGVSLAQFDEMESNGVQLVVPKALIKKYPVAVRSRLLSVQEFIEEMQELTELTH